MNRALVILIISAVAVASLLSTSSRPDAAGAAPTEKAKITFVEKRTVSAIISWAQGLGLSIEQFDAVDEASLEVGSPAHVFTAIYRPPVDVPRSGFDTPAHWNSEMSLLLNELASDFAGDSELTYQRSHVLQVQEKVDSGQPMVTAVYAEGPAEIFTTVGSDPNVANVLTMTEALSYVPPQFMTQIPSPPPPSDPPPAPPPPPPGGPPPAPPPPTPPPGPPPAPSYPWADTPEQPTNCGLPWWPVVGRVKGGNFIPGRRFIRQEFGWTPSRVRRLADCYDDDNPWDADFREGAYEADAYFVDDDGGYFLGAINSAYLSASNFA